jgi:class 3 adenylate cyclase/tetratricopeptide (TPR) repeat protein
VATVDAGSVSARVGELVPFVPRLTLEWLKKSPELRWLEVEGTLAFIDISGFTAMSEKLSSSGRAGAEEVTEVMNATFSALLEVAYGEGGGLLKFGGDALLLLYEEEGHAARAARAAFEMRRTLRAIGRPRTSAGAVQLKMHAGLHSGVFQFFLVGDSHRELLVTGPAASRTVEMEAASEAGEILLSSETAAQLDPSTLGEEKGSGVLLQAAPDVHGELAPLPDVSDIPLELAVPAPLRAQLLEVGPLEGEHRHAAIAFVRYSGVDEIISTEGSASAAEAIGVLAETIQQAAADHEVTFLESDVDRDGGRIILVSGAPQTFGDDEERLLRTVRSIVDTGLPLPVHIGVSEGRVFTGQVGAPFRRTYTILGDTAALAARLMAKAGEDEIWVAASAYERGGSSFEASELEPLELKGKSEPVPAFVLGDLLPEAERPDEESGGERMPFVDRERERAVLAAAVAPVRMGFGTMVELIGEPGIGKSRLAEELESNCADMRKVAARCDQYESSTAYYPFRPLLRSLLDVELNGGGEHNRTVLAERLASVDEELVPWAPLLGAPLDVEVESTQEVDDLDPAFWRARLHGVLGKLLGGILDSATLLRFEDVHWMDDASSDLLRYLGTQLPTRPWLTCTTRRPVEGGFAAAEGTPPVPALSLRLEPIPEEDAKTLVRAAAGDRALSDEELAALMERGAGNPLFLQALASGDSAEESKDMPGTVEELVATRIDRLAPGDRALLRWASVLGVSFSGSLIAEVLEGDPNVAAASESWGRLGEFVEMDPDVPGAFRFRHGLIRDAAYEGLSYKRRRELHGRVAEVIERRHGDGSKEAAELLSLHFDRAERWPEAWRYSIEAGRRAWGKYANVEAAQFFARALEIVEQVPETPVAEVARVWESLGDARMRLGEYEGTVDAHRAAQALVAGAPVEQARLIQKEAIALDHLARYPEALDRLGEGLRVLEGLEEKAAGAERARLSGWYAVALQRQHRSQEAIEWCERMIPEAERSGARDALAHAYVILDWANVALGRIEQAVHSQLAAPIYEELGNYERLAAVLNNLGQNLYLEGRWDEALEHTYRAREAWTKVGDHTRATFADFNIAEILAHQGLLEEAEELLAGALGVRQAAGNLLEVAHTTSALARLAALGARFDEAQGLYSEARTLFEEEQDAIFLLAIDARIMESLVLTGESGRALADAEELLEAAATMEGVSPIVGAVNRLRGWALVQEGDFDEAQRAFEESLRIAKLHDPNYGDNRSIDYDVVLALDGLVRVRSRQEEAPVELAELVRERDGIVSRLGIRALPEFPFPTDRT